MGKTFEVVAYQPHWIHDGKKGWEDFSRLDQRRSYSLAWRVEMNWGDEQTDGFREQDEEPVEDGWIRRSTTGMWMEMTIEGRLP